MKSFIREDGSHPDTRCSLTVLLYGGDGYIGTHLRSLFALAGHRVVTTGTRIESRRTREELEQTKPDRVVSCTGRTHGTSSDGTVIKSIDYLEDPSTLEENVRDNLYGPVHLALLCRELGIHYTYVGTGCIYSSSYAEDGSAQDTYDEDAPPNFNGSKYSLVKGYTDQLLTRTVFAESALTLRIRLPIAATPHPRNTLTKLVSYPKIHSVENSVTCFTMLPLMVQMVADKLVGPYNFCNRGSISNGRIMELYKEMVDPNHTCELISAGQLTSMLPAQRSNTVLNTGKLEELFPDLQSAEDRVRECLKSYLRNQRRGREGRETRTRI